MRLTLALLFDELVHIAPLSTKGQLVIPAEIRSDLPMEPEPA